MPRGPKGEKRPADVIGAAIMVGSIATGEIEEPGPQTPASVFPGRTRSWCRSVRSRFVLMTPNENKFRPLVSATIPEIARHLIVNQSLDMPCPLCLQAL